MSRPRLRLVPAPDREGGTALGLAERIGTSSAAAGLPSVHPYASLYPLLTEPELEALAEDIRTHGQHEPVVMRQGALVDGRNRWLACARAGLEPKVREYDEAADGPVEDVIDSQNLHRRHLTAQQRALAGARILGRLAGAGKARKLANLRRGDEGPDGDKLTPSGKSIDVAAARSGSSPGSIKAAKKVLALGTAELVEAVSAGKIPISKAAVLAAAPPEQQRAALAGGREAGRRRKPAAAVSIPPSPPLQLELVSVPPPRPLRGRRPTTLRRLLALTLRLSEDEQRVLGAQVLSRLEDNAGWRSAAEEPATPSGGDR